MAKIRGLDFYLILAKELPLPLLTLIGEWENKLKYKGFGNFNEQEGNACQKVIRKIGDPKD